MDVGKLDRRITIEKQTEERDEGGQPKQVWTKVKTVWANVRFERGMEAIRNGKDTAVRRASIRIRYRTDIDEGMRVTYNKQVFQIHSILPDESDRTFMDLVVEGTK